MISKSTEISLRKSVINGSLHLFHKPLVKSAILAELLTLGTGVPHPTAASNDMPYNQHEAGAGYQNVVISALNKLCLKSSILETVKLSVYVHISLIIRHHSSAAISLILY